MKQLVIQVASIITLLTSFTLFAHNKVVVIPLGGDEPIAPTSKTIFYTDTTYSGNLGGLAGADTKCQAAADSQTPPVQGTFKAWLGVSTGGDAIPARPDFLYYDAPYKNVDDTIVANHFVDFLDGEFTGIIEPVSAPALSLNYWTGLEDDGQGAFSDCSNWTSATDQEEGIYGHPVGGVDSRAAWSGHLTGGCNLVLAILCFEQ